MQSLGRHLIAVLSLALIGLMTSFTLVYCYRYGDALGGHNAYIYTAIDAFKIGLPILLATAWRSGRGGKAMAIIFSPIFL